jgi:polyhydroxyalkanoate synthesis regulator phasin
LGRITPSPRKIYEETVEELKSRYRSSLVDQGHRRAFDLLLKHAWEAEQAAMANSSIPTAVDRLNLTSNLHNRKLVEELEKRVEAMEKAVEELEKEVLELKAQLQASRGGGEDGV